MAFYYTAANKLAAGPGGIMTNGPDVPTSVLVGGVAMRPTIAAQPIAGGAGNLAWAVKSCQDLGVGTTWVAYTREQAVAALATQGYTAAQLDAWGGNC